MASMDDYPPEALLADYPPPIATLGERLRSIVLRAFPDAIERVRPGWRIIGYDLPTGGRKTIYFAGVWPQVEHMHLFFQHGWAMRDPRGILQGAGITKQVRWLTFPPGSAIDEATCREYLIEAAEVARMSRGERALRAEDASGLR